VALARFFRSRDWKLEAYLNCELEIAGSFPIGAMMVGYFWVSGYLSSRSYPQRWVLNGEVAIQTKEKEWRNALTVP
jgi:hypothetical protein